MGKISSFIYIFKTFSPTLQNISQKNIANKAKQKFMHRMGPKNFAMIRQKLVTNLDLFVLLLYLKQQFFLINIFYFIFLSLTNKARKEG